MTFAAKPMLMGGVMGLMLLWMLHGQLTGASTLAGPALTLFIAAHVLVIALVACASLFLARLSPRLRNWLNRLHRPNLSHMVSMMVGVFITLGIVHAAIHWVG